MQRIRNHWFDQLAVVLAAGVVYYFVVTRLLGYAAAIAAPSWLFPFMEQHPSAGLLIMSLLTHIPAIAVAAAIFGYGLARLLPSRHFLFGVVTVCVMVLLAAVVAIGGLGFCVLLLVCVFWLFVFEVLTLLALWVFLAIAAQWFARSRRSKDNARAAASA